MRARQRARTKISEVPTLLDRKAERAKSTQDLATAGCEDGMLSQEAATEAHVIVDAWAPGFVSFNNSGGKGYVDPVTKKPCSKTAWAHQSQNSYEMRALGLLTKAGFLPSQVEATHTGVNSVHRGIVDKHRKDCLVVLLNVLFCV